MNNNFCKHGIEAHTCAACAQEQQEQQRKTQQPLKLVAGATYKRRDGKLMMLTISGTSDDWLRGVDSPYLYNPDPKDENGACVIEVGTEHPADLIERVITDTEILDWIEQSTVGYITLEYGAGEFLLTGSKLREAISKLLKDQEN